MLKSILAYGYTVGSILAPCLISYLEYRNSTTTFNTLVSLTAFKPNHLIFLNGFLVAIYQSTNLLIYIFFNDIRIIETQVR